MTATETTVDVEIDMSVVGGGDIETLPDGIKSPMADKKSPADGEPKTIEPAKSLGIKRLRAPTLVGVAPPSAGGKQPPSTNPRPGPPTAVASSAQPTPRVVDASQLRLNANEGEDESTTMVGKMLAAAQAEGRRKLAEKRDEPDMYQDETATTVGDAENLIATANEAFAKIRAEGEGESDESTEQRVVRESVVEDTTARRDAIDVESALVRAKELKAKALADAEAKKRALKKRTFVGLGNGPLRLPAQPEPVEGSYDDDLRTEVGETKAPSSRRLPAATPGDSEPPLHGAAEPETVTVAAGHNPAALEAAFNEPATVSVKPQFALAGPFHTQTPLGLGAPQTQPMPHAPNAHTGSDPGFPAAAPNPGAPLMATLASAGGRRDFPSPRAFPNAPRDAFQSEIAMIGQAQQPQQAFAPGASGQVPVPPRSDPSVFARTETAYQPSMGMSQSGPIAWPPPIAPRVEPKPPKGGSKAGVIAVVLLLLLCAGGGAAYWKRVQLRAFWDRHRHPQAAEPVPAPPESASAAPPASASAAPPGSASASPPASASASASAKPAGSASAAPSSSASTKPPVKKPPPWRPRPKFSAPKPKPAPDDDRGF